MGEMQKAGLWTGAVVLIDGRAPAMVQVAKDGLPVRVIHRRPDRLVEMVEASRLTVVPLAPRCWTHSRCGAVVLQRGERTSHCPRCHITFEGLTLFDAHQRIDAVTGRVTCSAPNTMLFRGKRLRFVEGERGADGSWRGHMDRDVFGGDAA